MIIGQTLAQYRIVEMLGEGGMGQVYRAEDMRLDRDVALKVLSQDRSTTARETERFLKEARAAAALRHPNICTIYDAGEETGVWYISMAFIPGRSLKDVISHGPLPLELAIDVAVQVAQGLQAAHDRGIVHRDIKPGNIIIDDDGRATILDFGVAKLTDHSPQTDESCLTGTITHMSPEQARGEDVDHRTDIWSLGVCLYEMISGELPFKGDHFSAVIYQILNLVPQPLARNEVDVPRAVTRIVSTAMQKRPEQRYQIVDEMLADLKLARRELETGSATEEPSIAVLPFTNLSADRNQDYFCDGMSEEIINNLVHIQGLRVVARTSSFAFRDSKLAIAEIGRKLDATTVLEGSVQKSGNRLRITAQFINTSDGYHLWSERYDRELEDVFAIQEEIAHNIVDALKVQLTEKEEKAIDRVPTQDMRAYDFYIRGLHQYHKMDRKNLEIARNMFTSAFVRDPSYALAYCGLTACYAMLYAFYNNDRSIVENALTAAEKALELDPDLAEAHASYGLALSLENRFDEAEKEFLRALEIAPKLFDAYYFYARACRTQGRMEKAAELFEMASKVRPEDYQSPILAGDSYRGLNRPDDVKRAFRKGLSAAERHLELHPEESRVWYLGAHAHFELGDTEKALEWNNKAMQLSPRDPAALYNAACLFSLLGKFDDCFECFERAVDHGFSNINWLKNDPDLEPIRNDPRYKALLDQMSGT